jgi:hypothetical protein
MKKLLSKLSPVAASAAIFGALCALSAKPAYANSIAAIWEQVTDIQHGLLVLATVVYVGVLIVAIGIATRPAGAGSGLVLILIATVIYVVIVATL